MTSSSPVSSAAAENYTWDSNLRAVLAALTCISSDGPCPALATGLGQPGGSSSPLPMLHPREQQSSLIDPCCGRMGGAEGGTGKGSDSIFFVPGSKQRGYCLLIDCL